MKIFLILIRMAKFIKISIVFVMTLERGIIKMKYYSVPSDFQLNTIDKYNKLNNEFTTSLVNETYGQLTVGVSHESGRLYDDIPKIDLKQLEKYVTYSKNKNIDFNYTLNGTCMGNKEFTNEGIKNLKKFFKDLENIGVQSVTLALPSLFEIVKSIDCKLEIKSSTLCQVTNANKAISLKKLGADRIVVEESINRDFSTLQRITNAFGDKVEVIVNTLCNKDCIYRPFHYNQMSHDCVLTNEESIKDHYNNLCIMKRIESLSNLLKINWIRPEDIELYTQVGINHFKIQGRNAVMKGNCYKVVRSYFEESFDGNLMDLLELYSNLCSFKIYIDNKRLDGYVEKFFQNRDFCKRDCENCKYCDNVIMNCLDYEKSLKVNELANKFYGGYDKFLNTIKEALQS